MDARRAKGTEAVVFSASLHWVVFAPALLCLGIAGAVQSWSTQPLVERFGLEVLAEQVTAATGFDLDGAITVLASLIAAIALASGLLRILTTRLGVTATGVCWQQRGSRTDAGFASIEGVQVEQGMLGRILGYGTVEVLGRNAIGRRRPIANPNGFRRACDDRMSKWLCRDLGTDPRRKVSAA